MSAKNPWSILVAEDRDEILGNILIIAYGKKVSYLFRLAVRKEYRNQGVASALIQKAEEIVRQGGSVELGLYVDSGNIDMQDFYKKRSFKISPKSYFYMWKELTV